MQSGYFFALALGCTVRASIVRAPIGRVTALDRRKLNTSPDSNFYESPKLVTHCDDAFVTALTNLYNERISGSRVLDLMASHVSHLPEDRLCELYVTGHGMNADELAANPALSERHVADLNIAPSLPFAATASYDAILCCAGVQYLQEPEAVFAECARALKPHGVLIVSFTDKFFFPKAIQGWIDRGMSTRAKLVKDYMRAAGGFSDIEIVGGGTSLLAQLGSISGLGGDPFVAVVGTRAAESDDIE